MDSTEINMTQAKNLPMMFFTNKAAPQIVRQLLEENEGLKQKLQSRYRMEPNPLITDIEKENEVLREQNLMAVEEINSLELKIKKLESRNAKLIDETNKSMLQAHDYMNKLLNLEEVRKAAKGFYNATLKWNKEIEKIIGRQRKALEEAK